MLHSPTPGIPRFAALLLPLLLWVAHPVYHPVPDVNVGSSDVGEDCLLCLIAAHSQPVETFAPAPVPELIPTIWLPVARPERLALRHAERAGAGARAPPRSSFLPHALMA